VSWDCPTENFRDVRGGLEKQPLVGRYRQAGDERGRAA
jgi:hypothetical protein